MDRRAGPLLKIATTNELASFIGRELPASSWLTVGEGLIASFCALTGDKQWIHLDAERARHELREGGLIAPGQLLLSLIPSMLNEMYEFEGARSSRVADLCVRFRRPVIAGRTVRLRASFQSVVSRPALTRLVTNGVLELESGETALSFLRTDVFL